MTVEVIHAAGRVEAWVKAARRLLESERLLNLVLDIASTCVPGTEALERRIDSYMASQGQDSLHSVAETIFPCALYLREGSRGVLELYPKNIYPVLKKREPRRWGNYAGRLLRRETSAGDTINPLDQMLRKMRSEVSGSRTKRACYELGICPAEYELPLYSAARDRRQRMGFPCLSHLSFKLWGNAVHLTALYRSHDYGVKVPGNLLGLSRLLLFVAKETGQQPGGLVVHSSYAYIDVPRTPLRGALDEIERFQGGESSS